MTVTANYREGTYRTVSPEETLRRITPHLHRCGVTRCTSVTHLDTLGVPTYCSIRPDAAVLQVSNGKGISDAAAKVSALMEAIELFHAENPLPERLSRTHAGALRAGGHALLNPEELWGFHEGYYSERFVIDWTAGEDLQSGATVWAPAGSVYFYRAPSLFNTGTNGLASGNHVAEATLHALYELIERDAMTRLFEDGKLNLGEGVDVIRPETVDHPELSTLIERVEADNTKVVLIRLKSAVPVHTFWALFLNRDALTSLSTLNGGWGTHPDRDIAASRALTEAAQSRLTAIHGAREDILAKPVNNVENVRERPAFRYFDHLTPDASWSEFDVNYNEHEADDLESAVERITGQLVSAGKGPVIRFDLTHPDKNIPVVKITAPRLQFDADLF